MHVDITSVFILAQNRLLREALARLLSKKADLRIAGASDFSSQLVQVIAQASPDVLLSDPTALAIPQMHIVQEIRAAVPGLKVVMIGMEAGEDIFLQAVRDGISGYVLKDASAAEVASAVRCWPRVRPYAPLNCVMFCFDMWLNSRSGPITCR